MELKRWPSSTKCRVGCLILLNNRNWRRTKVSMILLRCTTQHTYDTAWTTYWSPILRALTTQCFNPCREIRQQAFASLQRTLLSNELASPDHKEWTAIFGEVLFPLITQLLKPEVYQSDPVGMSETRVRASTLLCKVFLHYLVMLSEWEGMLDLWLKIISIMDRLINSGQGDNLVRPSIQLRTVTLRTR